MMPVVEDHAHKGNSMLFKKVNLKITEVIQNVAKKSQT